MVKLNTPLYRTIERRMLETLRNSKNGYMTFAELVRRSKCERWFELCKHVYGGLEYKCLVESPTAGNLVALRRSPWNYMGMDESQHDYLSHLESIERSLEIDLAHVKESRLKVLRERLNGD